MVNLKFALRTLFKTPFVTIFAIISIALGIGANTAMFSIFEQILLHPLPVEEPNRLVNLATPGPAFGMMSCGDAGGCDEVFSYPMYRDLEKIQTVFKGIAGHFPFKANLAARGETLNGRGLLVSGSYFSVLGVKAALGRTLNPKDDRVIGQTPVVVLSHAYWKTRFNKDPGVLNQTMVINGQVMTIVGVAPQGFEGTTLGLRPQVFVPITMCGFMERGFMDQGFDLLAGRRYSWVYLFARLKPETTMEQARASINGQYHAIINEVDAPLQKDMSEQAMAQFRAKQIALKEGARGQSIVSGEETKTILSMLLALAAFVLIIACANVANLLLARGAARSGEMAIRLSIGSSRARVVMQLLTESCLLALIAGGAGILAAQWTLDSIASLIPAEVTPPLEFTLNMPALMFAAILTLGTGLLFGLFPALHAAKPELVSSLKGQAGQTIGAKSASRFRVFLVTAQLALSLALLIIAGLFAKSLYNISRVDPGMKVDRVVAFGISPFRNGYTHQGSLQLFGQLEDRLAALPGVTNVTNSQYRLFSGIGSAGSVLIDGKMEPGKDAFSWYNKIGTAYFHTLSIPLVSGREFERSDTASATKVAIINEAFANKFNLGREAVGRHIGYPGNGSILDAEIIGIVQNARIRNPKAAPEPMFFVPYRQDNQIESLTFYVQTSLDFDQLMPGIKKLIAHIDPNLPIENLRTMPQQIHDNTFGDRIIGTLSAAFACMAILLAAMGLYGVLAYTVAQRTREIGLRIALGASEAQVRAMVFQKVGIMTLIGCLTGLLFGVAIGRIAGFMLYQLQGSDPVVFGGSTIIMMLVALIAGFIPAYRASRIDPMQALRYE
jgi:predicted permease